jgi:RNA polymerase sigma-70 factor (ECF subfamily)
VAVTAPEPIGMAEQAGKATLVCRIRAGDQAAEEELVRRYARGLLLMLSANVADASAVEDLRQEALKRILEKIRAGEIREPEKLPGFVCSVARNVALEHFRGALRSRADQGLDEAAAVADTTPDAMQDLLLAETRRIVQRVLSEVTPPRYRQILYRYYVAEEDKARICADLGLSSLHFNRVLNRARDRYRELYLEAVRKGIANRVG